MSKININNAQIFGEIIHYSPLVYKHGAAKGLSGNGEIDRAPLYALSEDTENSDLCAQEIKALSTKAPYWGTLCEQSYSSPTNLKRVILTPDICYVEFHCAPEGFGDRSYKSTNQKSKSYAFIKLNNILKERVDPSIDSIKYTNMLIQFMLNYNLTTDIAYQYKDCSIKGNILSRFRTPWVASNIEEIIVDSKLIVSEDWFKTNDGIDFVKSGRKKIKPEYYRNWVLGSFNIQNISDINKQFPRLRVIAFANKLENVVKTFESENKQIEFNKIAEFFTDNNMIFKTKLFTTGTANALNIRTYYKFDKLILSIYNRELIREQSIKEEARRKEIEEQRKLEEARIEDSKLLVEKGLEEIEKTNGLPTAKAIASILEVIAQKGSLKSKNINFEQLFTPYGYIRYFS